MFVRTAAAAQPLLPKHRQNPLPFPKPVDWSEPPLIEFKFAAAQQRVTSSRTLAHQISISGTLVYLFFLCSFGFYAYARVGRTVSGRLNPGLVLYEVLVLLAEVGVFASSAMFGVSRVSVPPAAPPCSLMRMLWHWCVLLGSCEQSMGGMQSARLHALSLVGRHLHCC